MKIIIRILTCFIPVGGWRRAARAFLLRHYETFLRKRPYRIAQRQNAKLLRQLRRRVRQGAKVRVAFSVIYDASFPAVKLYERMLNDDLFDPFIVVIPDTSRGEENMQRALKQSLTSLGKKYGKVLSSYSTEEGRFIDISNLCDLCISANPYSSMTHEFYTVEYLLQHGVLSFYVGYSFTVTQYFRRYVAAAPSLNCLWKFFVECPEKYDECRKYMDVGGRNIVVSGYCKMDGIFEVKRVVSRRKKIIIAPHHTVIVPELPLSNFLIYADFFKKLPKLYPEIDWVFRPHPLLYYVLCKEEVWGRKKTDLYFDEIQTHENMVWQNGGDYFETFVNSDGIIHDCGSFVAEYLFTGHPACYLLKNEEEIGSFFNEIGQACMLHHYKAFCQQDIINFIERVVLAGNDPLENSRRQFAEKRLKINYPNATDYILNHLNQSLN